jgi:hypothetical protein
MKPTRLCIVSVTLAICLTACATRRLTQFNTFAQAGITYTTASQGVVTAAGTAAVNADSALLIHSRPSLNEDARRTTINKSDAKLKERLQLLQLINTHGKVLAAYFTALASLSDPKATDTVGTAAQSAYDSFSKISPDLKNAKLGSTSVSSFIPKVVAPIVAAFKVHALDAELKQRATAIADEIALQQAAFSAITSEFKTDLQEAQNLHEVDNINLFVSPKDLPTDWAAERLSLLSTPVTIAQADAASKAADQMGKAWADLVANKLDNNGLTLLMGDISNILSIAQTIEKAAD